MSHTAQRWSRRAAFIMLLLAAVLFAVGIVPSTADAAAPQRVGWWNSASAPSGVPAGTTAPSPSTPAGGLHIAAGPTADAAPTSLEPSQVPQGTQILAYGAVLYSVPEDSTGTLTLKIAGTPQGTPQLAACPTHNGSWTGGDDQPSSNEPAYDCTTQRYPGTVSADGSTISFNVKARLEPLPDVLSLAIVPDLSGTAVPGGGNTPFSVDIAPPDSNSMRVSEPSSSALPPPSGPSPSAATPAAVPASGFQPSYAPPPASLPSVSAGKPLGAPAVNTPPSTPTPAPAVGTTRPAPPSRPPSVTASANPASPLRTHIASALGAGALLAAVLLWSLGYGVLGGRVIPLSVPLKRG